MIVTMVSSDHVVRLLMIMVMALVGWGGDDAVTMGVVVTRGLTTINTSVSRK